MSKSLDKYEKALGKDTVNEMNSMSEEQLKQVIVQASSAMKQVKDELEASPEYQALKANLSALTQGKKDVDKRQKARIGYALVRLEEKGKE